MNNTCVLTLILQLLVTVEVPEPMLKASSLHISDESMYTNQTCTSNIVFPISFYKNLLCSPEFVPQIVGGALFPGVVTLKISVWHCPFSNILLPPILVTDVVARISTMLHISFETIFNFCSKLTRIWLIDDESIKIQTNLTNVIATRTNFQPTLASSYSSWRNKITAIFIGGLTTSIFNWKKCYWIVTKLRTFVTIDNLQEQQTP